MSEQKKQVNKKAIIIGVVAVIIIAVLIGIILYLLNRPKDDDDLINRGLIDETHKEDVIEDMSNKVAEGMFECRMSMHWTFDNGKAESKDAYVANAESNTHTICFDVYNNETEELLYSSPMLKIGDELTNFKLDKELEAGEYEARVQYRLVDEQEDGGYKEVSSAGFLITITVNS